MHALKHGEKPKGPMPLHFTGCPKPGFSPT